MALTDALPMFVPKSVSIRPTGSKLTSRKKAAVVEQEEPVIPESMEIKTEEEEIESPTIKEEIKDTPDIWQLPDVYEKLDPLAVALNDSSIVSPKARAAVLAQMGLETGWGDKLYDFNYGNITAGSKWSGDTHVRGDNDAKGNVITQKFRTYSSAKEFLDDYMGVLKRTYPAAYRELTTKDFDIDKFKVGLLGGTFKYAEDPEYGSRIARTYSSVIKRLGL